MKKREKTRKKNAALENTLQKAKVAVRKSKHEAQEREGELAAALATARMTQDLVDEANEEINALRAAVSAAEAQTASAQSQISDLESQLAAKDVSLAATSESASGKSAQLEAQIEELKHELLRLPPPPPPALPRGQTKITAWLEAKTSS